MRHDPLSGNARPPFFSIVIPCYNSLSTLPRTLKSCLLQRFQDFEIIVVDDGSREDINAETLDISDPRLRIHRQENAGGGAARNHGADLARGRYIAFLDADDVFLPNKLERFHQAILANADDKTNLRRVWYSPLYFQRGEDNRMVKPPRAIRPDERVGEYLFCDDGLLQTSTLVISHSFFQTVKFDPKLRNMQDLDLCLRLEAAGAEFHMLDEPLVIWFDETAHNRVSYTIKPDQVRAFGERHRQRLGMRAYHGLMARYLVPFYMRKQPVEAMKLVSSAVSQGALSHKRALMLLARGAAPVTYMRLRDRLVSRFGQ